MIDESGSIYGGAGWIQKRLGDVCRPVGGGTPSRSQPQYWNGELPWASVKDFTDDSIVLSDTQEQITQRGLESSASTLVPKDTPVICTRMAVGRCALTTRPTAINQDLKALLLNEEFELKFFIRLLRFHAPKLDRLSIGSTVRGINTNDLLSLPLSYPNKLGQERIAAVLDAADEAIAKTEAVIAKLRQVRAGVLYDLLTCGLDAYGHLRDPIVHPEQFQDSPLGRIPRDWGCKQLRDLVQPNRRITYGIVQPGEFDPNGILLIRGQDYISGWASRESFFKVAPTRHESYRRSLTKAGDLLLCIVGATTGAVAQVPEWIDEANITQTTARVSTRTSRPAGLIRRYRPR
jgi:type I restriction enzyme S subunit